MCLYLFLSLSFSLCVSVCISLFLSLFAHACKNVWVYKYMVYGLDNRVSTPEQCRLNMT